MTERQVVRMLESIPKFDSYSSYNSSFEKGKNNIEYSLYDTDTNKSINAVEILYPFFI